MSNIYVTNDVKKIFILAFRQIFETDTDFMYSDDDNATLILIASKYANAEIENTIPQVIVSTAGYSSQPTAFMNNFATEFQGNALLNKDVSREHANIVNIQMTLDCVSSNKAESEFIADKVYNFMTREYQQLFEYLGINIRGISVGESIARNQVPQEQYVCSVNVTADFTIAWVMGPNTDIAPMSKYIKLNYTTVSV